MPIEEITSDKILSDIERHFKVSAGPGAGKTYWLVQHIKNLLHNSKRLDPSRKIACITYTNIAVDAIVKQLDNSSDKVEVTTIHSFLYKHIVKPYASFVATEYDLKVQLVDGHDDTILSSYSFLKEWKQQTQQQRIRDDTQITSAFKALKWRFDTSGELIINTDYPYKVDGYAIKKSAYLNYKKMAWAYGVVHHDDVLFFSYQIIKKYPFVLDVIRAKFPYFFVDEFQDSNPIQVAILKQIGQKETIVGIIGDNAQSIYGFQGADCTQFESFYLPEMRDYTICLNRRSTKTIINMLNLIRTDLVQSPFRDAVGERPVIIIGDMVVALGKLQETYPQEIIHSLTRENITTNILKKAVTGISPEGPLLDELYNQDSDSDRRKLVNHSIRAIELSIEGKFKEAIKILQREFKEEQKEAIKQKTINTISIFLARYPEIEKATLYDFFCIIEEITASDTAKPTRGKVKIFYDTHTYQQLAICVKIPDDASTNRTIHGAKGDEFDNVLLVLKKPEQLSFLLSPNISSNEEHRIYYVAASRAKNRLFISVPAMSDEDKTKLSPYFEINYIS